MKKFVLFSLVCLSILAFGAVGYSQQLYQYEKGKPGSPHPLYQPGNYAEAVVGEKPPVLEFRTSGQIYVIYELNKNVRSQGPPGDVNHFVTPADQAVLFGQDRKFAPMDGLSTAGTTVLNPIPTGPLAGVLRGQAFDKNQSYWETRTRIAFIAAMGKQVSGTVHFEIDAGRWGERQGTGHQRNQAGAWGADSAAVEVKNAFISFAVPPIIPVPVTVNAGILTYVTRPVLGVTDGTGIAVVARPGPAQIKFQWMQAIENQDWASDDAEIYQLEAKAAVGRMNLGGYVIGMNANTYPFQTSTSATFSSLNTTYINRNKANFYWWGFFADGSLGPLGINTDFVYDYGMVFQHGDSAIPGAAAPLRNPASEKKVDYRGFIGRLAIDFPWEKFNFGIVGMYATGSDLEKTSASGLPGTVAATGLAQDGYTRRVSGYVVHPGSEHGYEDEGIVIFGCGGNGLNQANTSYGTSNPNLVNRGQYGGTWFAKLYGSFKPAPWYRITLLGMYIGDTTKHGNTIGSAMDYIGGGTTLKVRDDKDIGFEFDLYNDVQIYKNLQLRFGGGYLIAGSAMAYRDQRVGTLPTPLGSITNVTPSNPWAFATKLIYAW